MDLSQRPETLNHINSPTEPSQRSLFDDAYNAVVNHPVEAALTVAAVGAATAATVYLARGGALPALLKSAADAEAGLVKPAEDIVSRGLPINAFNRDATSASAALRRLYRDQGYDKLATRLDELSSPHLPPLRPNLQGGALSSSDFPPSFKMWRNADGDAMTMSDGHSDWVRPPSQVSPRLQGEVWMPAKDYVSPYPAPLPPKGLAKPDPDTGWLTALISGVGQQL
jgi:hypothetical protein